MPEYRSFSRLALLMICAIMLVACASEPAYPPRARAHYRPLPPQNPAAELAISLIGTPYRYGGATPRGFDCSGLVYYTFRRNGIHIPRSTRSQYHTARRVARRDLRPGDLVFFKTNRHEVSHVGIYTGADRFVHAPSRGKQVSFASLDDDYWRRHFIGAGRYF